MTENEEKVEPSRPQNDERWARELIGRVAFAALIEQRRARRWGIFFKFLFFTYLFALLLIYWPVDWEGKGVIGKRHTALVNLDGLIASQTDASAENVIGGLRAAFEDGATAGVILQINSPGGSPVQAGRIYEEILRLRKKYPDIPLYAVASDVCASGGYYVAAAAQKIYANKASIIGSIGVVAGGFGFVEALDKLGIERRLYTAGENKGFLDPFSPTDPENVRHLEKMLNAIHQQFITAVQEGRGDRLTDSGELFTGLVWTGEQSLDLGLVDGLGSPRYVAEEIIGAKTIVDYTRRPGVFDRLLTGVQSALSKGFGNALRLDDTGPAATPVLR